MANSKSGDEPNEVTNSIDGLTVINFKDDVQQNCYAINTKNVKVIGSDGNHNHGSSQVKLKNVVDYKWEVKNHPGHLIAVHLDGKHVAYAIKVNSKNGGMEGMVRVFNVDSNLRTLIKGMCGEVLDLQFAHIDDSHLLACIDVNSLFVHTIVMMNGNLTSSLVVKIDDPMKDYIPKFDKIAWCPFLDVASSIDDSRLIVWARGSKFQCFNVKTIISEYGFGNLKIDDIEEGYLKYQDDATTITWITLSPDASTLGVGGSDGIVKFFQIYMHDDEPRCLHQWNPHKGKPVSSVFFLDDLTNRSSDSYWKYALTGAANNTELKVWDCSNWECLQTITIGTTGESHKNGLHLIAELSLSASYLVLSCFETRTAYVLQIDTSFIYASLEASDDEATVGKRAANQSRMFVSVKSIAEFPLSSVVLSFSIVDAAVRRYKCGNDDNYFVEEMDDYDEETNSIVCVVVRMFFVQPKSLQECRILYQPTVTEADDVKSTISTVDTLELNVSKDSNTGENFAIKKNSSIKLKHINGQDDQIKADDKTADEKSEIFNNKSNSNNGKEEEKQEEQASNDITTKGEQENELEKVKESKEPNVLEALFNRAAAANNGTVSPDATVVILEEKTELPDSVSPKSGNKQARYGQLNLMTPEAFTCRDKTPEGVSSEVMNTLLFLASAKNNANSKGSDVNRLNLVNNKVIEEQEQKKQKQALESKNKFIAIESATERSGNDAGLASGASSPSREVREIMSLQDYDKNSYSGDELLEETQTEEVLETEGKITSKSKGADKSTEQRSKPATHSKHSTELQNAANLISQAVHASSSSNLSSVPPTFGNATSSSTSASTTIGTVVCSSADLNSLNMKMNHLIELVKVQSMQINSLQNEIADIKKCNPLASAKNLSEFSFKLEMQLSKLLEQYLKRMENEHNKKLASFIAGRDVQHRELRESYIQILNQYLLTQVGDIVSKVITIEIQRQIAPMLSAKMDGLHKQLQMDVTQKLTSFDMMLNENISQVCKSKNIIETFGKSVLLGVQNSLQAAFIESMSTTLIPAYEKSSQNMFKQLHETFSEGIREFMLQLDHTTRNIQPAQPSSDDMREQILALQHYFDTMLNKHRGIMNDSLLETRKDVKSMEILLVRQIQDTVRAEIRKCLDNQAVAMRSQTNTPAPTMYDMRESIKSFLQQGQINKAFHQALLANDLSLVEYTLKQADHNTVFNPQCCLEQKVLLSLIQQISADMSKHNEIKQNYLSEALLAIDSNDPITREHGPKVLKDLFHNCQMYLMNYPKSPQCSNVRMLLKGIQGFKDQF